ncbi:MAG: oxaloacetate decarboxylase (Na+ extruding) subunit alpha [Thermotogota bacterium]|nr:oxaloacetate decarboxylase (Na+ extruding) subunit alpha [Thermotogota bacterium]
MDTKAFTDTTLRDAHQSLLATRMRTDEMEPALELLDNLEFNALEMWGGATFDACVRFLKEDPWERLKRIRAKVKKTRLQMLLRGQNLVGYRNYPDDVVEVFIKKTAENGLDIIRVFDALNDERNLEKSIQAGKEFGLHVQGAISYTVSPVHTIDYYVEFARKLVDLGVDSLCVKDMAGLLTPKTSYELVKKLKEIFDLPVEIHSHCTTGLAEMAYAAALNAGADVVDTAISPLSGGTSQPPVESFLYSYTKVLDDPEKKRILLELEEHFENVRKNHSDTDVAMLHVNPRVLIAQIPGGMYSNMLAHLKSMRMESKLSEVLEEVPRVRRDLGYPPLVTPMSQIVGVQAIMNVATGKRYERVIKEVKDYVRGFYGRPPVPLDPEFVKMILQDEEIIHCRPADLLEPQFEKARNELGVLAASDEDVLIYILLGEVGKQFLEEKYMAKSGIDEEYLEELEENVPEGGVYPV